MKNIIFLTGLIIFSNLNAQNNEKTTFGKEILNGEIKSIKQLIYENNKVDTMLHFFNEIGLLKEEIQLGQQIIYSYNSNNQKIKSITYFWKSGGIESHSNEYIYDNGNLIKHILKYPPSTPKVSNNYNYFVTNYKYNISKQLIEEKKIGKRNKDMEESFSYHYKYQYDSTGNRTIEEHFNANGNIITINKNKYVNNRLIETFTWMAFEGEDSYLKSIYVYDENENLKSHIKIVYMYNSTTDIVDSTATNYFYDDKQRLIKIVEPWYPNNKTTFYSDFDMKDNWLQKIIIDNNGKQKKVIREIEYYKE